MNTTPTSYCHEPAELLLDDDVLLSFELVEQLECEFHPATDEQSGRLAA